jgi:membrane protein required for colicin V production
MEVAGFSGFDICVLATLFLGALFGLVTGFVRGGLFVASWIGAGLGTIYGFSTVTPIAASYISPGWLSDLVAGAALFIVALIVLHLVSHIFSGWVRSGRLNSLDRSLGMLAGLATAGIFVCVAYLFFSDVWGEEQPGWVESARTRPAVERGALLVRDLLPEDLIGQTGAALERAQQEANDIGAAKKVLDRLISPPEFTAPLPKEGYKEDDRESIDDLIRKAQ